MAAIWARMILCALVTNMGDYKWESTNLAQAKSLLIVFQSICFGANESNLNVIASDSEAIPHWKEIASYPRKDKGCTSYVLPTSLWLTSYLRYHPRRRIRRCEAFFHIGGGIE